MAGAVLENVLERKEFLSENVELEGAGYGKGK